MATLAPVSFRFVESDLSVIDRAARLRGRSRTEFVRDAAVLAAEAIVQDATLVRMTPEDFAALSDHLDMPGEPSAGLKQLLAARA